MGQRRKVANQYAPSKQLQIHGWVLAFSFVRERILVLVIYGQPLIPCLIVSRGAGHVFQNFVRCALIEAIPANAPWVVGTSAGRRWLPSSDELISH